MEKSMTDKFRRIEEEIDFKVAKWKTEMERYDRWKEDYNFLDPIFNDFKSDRRNILCEQNRIDLIWHELKQTIEVKLEEIADEIGEPAENIPWHSIFCNICRIYRDSMTEKKFSPPRFAYDLDPETKIASWVLGSWNPTFGYFYGGTFYGHT